MKVPLNKSTRKVVLDHLYERMRKPLDDSTSHNSQFWSFILKDKCAL